MREEGVTKIPAEAGFIDGEGFFLIDINTKRYSKTGWFVTLRFQIILHKRDLKLLELIKATLGVGNIYADGKDCLQFKVSSIEQLQVVINHFDIYSLITQKQADYLLWREAFLIVSRKDHLTPEGLQKIVAIKASMNLGLSPALKAAFPRVLQ